MEPVTSFGWHRSTHELFIFTKGKKKLKNSLQWKCEEVTPMVTLWLLSHFHWYISYKCIGSSKFHAYIDEINGLFSHFQDYLELILWPLSSDRFQALIKERPWLQKPCLNFARFGLCFHTGFWVESYSHFEKIFARARKSLQALVRFHPKARRIKWLYNSFIIIIWIFWQYISTI